MTEHGLICEIAGARFGSLAGAGNTAGQWRAEAQRILANPNCPKCKGWGSYYVDEANKRNHRWCTCWYGVVVPR